MSYLILNRNDKYFMERYLGSNMFTRFQSLGRKFISKQTAIIYNDKYDIEGTIIEV